MSQASLSSSGPWSAPWPIPRSCSAASPCCAGACRRCARRPCKRRPDVGNRLSKIYTRTGDDGSTGLGDGTRVAKDSARVGAYGTVDEANSAIGLLLAAEVPDPIRDLLTTVQHQLFDLGGELCIPGHAAIHDADIDALESALDGFNADLPPLREFILPGGGDAAARCHVARTVVRRAERETVSLARMEDVRPQVVRYLNRLSDLLFVLARVLARADGHGEVTWKHERRKAQPRRSEEHTSELQSLMRISYAVFCLKKKNKNNISRHICICK